MMRTCSPLAILYNDRMVLENHHSAAAFKIMTEDDHLLQFKVYCLLESNCKIASAAHL